MAKKISSLGDPGAFAIARNQVGRDIVTAVFLYRVKFFWRDGAPKRLTRLGKEWIAMSRDDWARSSGLSIAELKNRALPRARKLQFLTIRTMKLKPTGPNLIWVSLDLSLMAEWTTPWDTHEFLIEGGTGPGYEKQPTYPYKKED